MIELKNYQRTAVHELKERVDPCTSLDNIYQSYRKRSAEEEIKILRNVNTN